MKKLSARLWLTLILIGLVGQFAWTIENMYFNVFLYNTISTDPGYISAMVGWSAAAATLTTLPCAVTAVSDDGSLGERALVTKPLEAAICARKPDVVMACGPTPMLAAVQALCETYGVPCQLSLEERMGCGIGACLGCNVKIMQPDGGWRYKRVCKDGPVFDAKEVCLRG